MTSCYILSPKPPFNIFDIYKIYIYLFFAHKVLHFTTLMSMSENILQGLVLSF